MGLTASGFPARIGMSLLPENSLLLDRARDFLAGGPADAVPLVSRVCQMPGIPGQVAEHLARTLFGDHPDFARVDDGRWCLAQIAPAPPARSLGVWSRLEIAASPAPRRVAEPARVHHVTGAPPVLRGMSYAVVDVETTGGSPFRGHRITEIAIVVVRDGVVCANECFETLVNPERSIPPFITRLTNISWEMVREKPTFRDICEHVLRAIDGRVFVAHNAAFDWKFVTAEVERAIGRRLGGPRLCTVRLSRKLHPQLRRRNLDAMAFHYGVDIASRHRAGGDALATAHVLLGLLRDAGSHGVERWDELERLLAAGTGARRRRRRPRALPHPVSTDTTA